MSARLRTLAFLVTALPLGALGAALLLAGWLVVLLLAVTPLVVPALIGFRGALGGLARVESALANALLGTRIEPETGLGGTGFWRRGLYVLERTSFWTHQAHALQRFVIGGTYAVLELTLLGGGLGAVSFPLWYRWSDTAIGSWRADSFARSLLWVPAGLAAFALGIALLGPLGRIARSFAVGLLGRRGTLTLAATPAARRSLAAHAAVVALVNALLIAIWAVLPHTSFWPVWTLLSTSLPVGLHAWVVLAAPRYRGRASRGLAVHQGAALCLFLFTVGVWAAAGRGTFWPIWVVVASAATIAAHVALEYAALRARRITRLEETRAGIVDQQDTELRRIERDLHDGAQATLVALGMSIGMAEQKLISDPGAAQLLLAEARRGAQDALQELRDLARGIHPPVLADRGLEAAIAALAARSALQVHVAVDLPTRPAGNVETAAYFVVAESLANAGKHASAGRVEIDVREAEGSLVAEVRDDGVGGADPSGSGLHGLERRVAALDGTLTVTSPAGGPTTIRAELPCAR